MKLMTNRCKDCKAVIDESEIGNCPYCEDGVSIVNISRKKEGEAETFIYSSDKDTSFYWIKCAECGSEYSESFKDCPRCMAESRKEESSHPLEDLMVLSDMSTREMGERYAGHFINKRLGKDFDEHAMLSFIAKYCEFGYLLSTFLADMEKAVIPNIRNTPIKKLAYIQPFFEFIQAEGSKFEDILFGEILDEKTIKKMVKIDYKKRGKGTSAEFYKELEGRIENEIILGRILHAHKVIKPVWEWFLTQDLEDYDAEIWEGIKEETVSLIKKNLFRK